MTSSKLLNFIPLGFLLAVVAIVFWQIETDFQEQGIASGGPYDNAASYPGTIAIVMLVLIVLQALVELSKERATDVAEGIAPVDLRRAGMMLGVFAVYLSLLTTVGYHLATAPMICAVMWICGMRSVLKMGIASIAIATGFAFIFEVFLNVVLPLGIWGIYIPW